MKDITDDLRGVIGVLATPFTDDDSIDTAALRGNVKSSIQAGVSGFLVPAYAGEVKMLSDAERALVVETVLDEASGKVPVVGGATAEEQHVMVRNAKALIGLGCRVILADVKHTGNDDEYRRNVHEVAGTCPEVFMLQDVDGQGDGAPVDSIAVLFEEIDCFSWIKTEVKGRCRKITKIREEIGPTLRVGSAGINYIEALDRGVDAYMPTAFHDLYVLVYNLHKRGERDRAKEVFYSFMPMLVFCYSHASTIFNKRLLMKMGIYKNDRIRVDFGPYDEYETRLTDELIEQYLAVSESLKES